MKTHPFASERIDVVCKGTYAETTARFEQTVPAADAARMQELVHAQADRARAERELQSLLGEFGFMVVAKVEQGPVVSLLGRPKKMTLYLVANPLGANRMFEQEPAAVLYAPMRAALYEDYEGVTHFTYDRPSGALGQFQEAEIAAVGQALDEKMSALAERLAG